MIGSCRGKGAALNTGFMPNRSKKSFKQGRETGEAGDFECDEIRDCGQIPGWCPNWWRNKGEEFGEFETRELKRSREGSNGPIFGWVYK